MTGLLLTAAGVMAIAAPGCPAPLPDSAYATRCTGLAVTLAHQDGRKIYRDCPRGARPTHPLAPKLKALVEKLRCALGDRVVITSGFRSRRHNLYSWAYVQARTPRANPVSRNSRHMVGKAVDFFVRGYAYGDLKRLETKLQQWAGRLPAPLRGSSKAIWTHVYRKGEGRDPDNLHPYPYLHLQLRD
ncbi:MAG: D-Ala-D-Ala carboxypeptidase family metallohydrolase [SAR324 cluster bacterium]|nr:D-Ala-D-Ala carboxypeptidase family metallohydrolase [SAR324 cluster bacterium]